MPASNPSESVRERARRVFRAVPKTCSFLALPPLLRVDTRANCASDRALPPCGMPFDPILRLFAQYLDSVLPGFGSLVGRAG